LNFKPSSRAPRPPSPPSRVLVLVVARRRASRIIGVRTAVSRADAALVADPRAVAVAPFASSIVSRRAPDPSRASFARSRVVVARKKIVARARARADAPTRPSRRRARGDPPRKTFSMRFYVESRARRRRARDRARAASGEKTRRREKMRRARDGRNARRRGEDVVATHFVARESRIERCRSTRARR
jgi:hypothetical protein